MQALSHLVLNMAAPNAALVCYAVQNDKLSRYVVAELADGDQALVPESGTLFAIRYLKPDGTGGFYDTLEDGTPAVAANGSTLTIGYASQVLTVPGDVYVQLQLLSGTGEVLTSFAWILRVFRNVWTDEQVESSDYYSILSQQIADVLGAAESLTGMTATATGLPAGSAPTVNVTGGTEGQPYNLALGIPAGPTGPAPTVASTSVQYQASNNGTTPPTGTWSTSVPEVTPGNYLWTRARAKFGDSWTAYWYAVSYRGLNGSGAVSTVNGKDPDAQGNVTLTALDVGAAVSVAGVAADAQGNVPLQAANLDVPLFSSGDTFNATVLYGSGYITSDAEELDLTLEMPKLFRPGASVSISAITVALRVAAGGYLGAVNGYDMTAMVRSITPYGATLRINCTSSTAFQYGTGGTSRGTVTNNTPVVGYVTLTGAVN